MIRLYVLVEGPTEERFVKDLLVEHLRARRVEATPIIVTTKRDRLTGQKLARGGGHWGKWLRDLRRLTLEQQTADVRFTTLFDLYGLPDDFPKLEEHARVQDTARRAALLEQAMADVVSDHRFIPYLQRHEFEAFVLAGLETLKALLDYPQQLEGLEQLRQAIAGLQPEDIDDGPESAPSKRLLASIPGYRKTLHGPLVAEGLGLEALRLACPRFGEWLTKLEGLAEPVSGAAGVPGEV